MDIKKLAPATRSNEDLFRRAVVTTIQSITTKVFGFCDIGGGDGKESQRLGKLLHATSVVCLDHHFPSLVRARARNVLPIQADLNHPFPLTSRSMDVIAANQVIEHLAKTDRLVEESYRILKPGGYFLVCTPNLASWHNVLALSLGWQPFSSQISDQVFLGNPKHPNYKEKITETQAHLRLFTHRSLKELLEFHGFDAISVQGIGFYPLSGILAKIFAILDPVHSAYILILARKPDNRNVRYER